MHYPPPQLDAELDDQATAEVHLLWLRRFAERCKAVLADESVSEAKAKETLESLKRMTGMCLLIRPCQNAEQPAGWSRL